MPEKEQKALQGYEFSSAAFLLATVLCGIALLMRPSLVEWAVALFLFTGALASGFAAYLLVRHAYEDPRFKGATLLVWIAGTVFVFALLWVQYGGG
jgi:hypothetical protein